MYEEELQDELARRRYSQPLTIRHLVPIETQLDQSQLVIFKDLQSEFGAWNSRHAGRSVKRILPETPGIYMFVWSPNAPFNVINGEAISVSRPFSSVMYVGIAEDSIYRRYDEYFRILQMRRPEYLFEVEDTSRDGRLQKYLSIYPLQFWWAPLSSRNQRRLNNRRSRVSFLKNIEERVIKFFNPPVNVQHTIKVHVGKEEKAWGGG